MRRLLTYLRPYWRQVAVALAAIIAGVGGAARAAISDQDGHRPLHRRQAISTASTGWPRLFLAVLVMAFAAEYVQTWTMQLTGQRIMFDLRMAIYGHLQRLDLALLRPQPGRPADDARHLRRRRAERSVHVRRGHGLRRSVHARRHHGRDARDGLAAGAGRLFRAAAHRASSRSGSAATCAIPTGSSAAGSRGSTRSCRKTSPA